MEREEFANVQLKLRLKENLRAQIERAAQEHKVSINQEMVRRLEKSFQESLGSERSQDLLSVLAQGSRLMEKTYGKFYSENMIYEMIVLSWITMLTGLLRTDPSKIPELLQKAPHLVVLKSPDDPEVQRAITEIEGRFDVYQGTLKSETDEDPKLISPARPAKRRRSPT